MLVPLDNPTLCGLRKKGSTDSMRSNISQGSSQLWEGLPTPDEDILHAVDEAASHQLRNDVDDPLEAVAPGVYRSDSTHDRSKRRLSQTDGPHTYQNRRQPFRLELDADGGTNFMLIDRPTVTSPDDSKRCRQGSISPSVAQTTAIVIAHSDSYQKYFDKYQLPWGVQWEIARLVSCNRIEYEDIKIDVLQKLAGKSNAIAAPKVEELLCGREGDAQKRHEYDKAFAKELDAKSPWSELDREEEQLARDPLSGLGGNSPQDWWYGGKVSFAARLRQEEQPKKAASRTSPSYSLELDPPELGTSTRMTRRWGSRRFLRVRIPESVIYQRNNQLLDYFRNVVIIHGKVFQPFYAKDSRVFLLEVDQAYSEKCGITPNPNPRNLSMDKFLNWHNPMQTNRKQSLAKWCARMALGLSNSVPGVEFAEENIVEIKDIYSPAGQAAITAGRKPDSKDIMTDGCGFTNTTTLVDAKYRYSWDLVPSALQFRLGGKKGLLLRHPDDTGAIDDPPKIWTRESQNKISYAPGVPTDRAHLVLDILRRSLLKYPARLSAEIIVNLAENGVTYDVFERLMVDGLEAIAASLTQWSGPYAMQNLWAAVARQGGVVRSRMSREAGGSSRARGFDDRDREAEEDNEDKESADIVAHSKAWWGDELSGCPSTLEETVLILLDAGFEPQSCHILAAKLQEVFKRSLNSYIEKHKIEVPRSAEAWIVPDPCGVLEPDNIFLRTSQPILGHDGLITDHLLGDVLVARHPCCVPSDVQKVHAVWKDELRSYYDVIVFSVKGKRSLASMLGGGDYDGDTVHMIWDPHVVAAFKNADEKFADPPPALDDAFETNTMTVEHFLKKEHASHEIMSAERQNYLLAALRDVSLVGSYSNWHDTAVYRFGYDSEEAWRLAYMFCEVLDSTKTGKTAKAQILKKDRATYNGPGPEWKAALYEDNYFTLPPDQGAAPRREGRVMRIKFIMDQLKATAKEQYNYHMSSFEKLLQESRQKFKAEHSIETSYLFVDPALEAPWQNAVERAQRLFKMDNQRRMVDELDAISRHVGAVCERHRLLMRQAAKDKKGSQSTSPRKESAAFTGKSIEQRQNLLRELSLAFSQMPRDVEFVALSPEDVKRYKASYAYVLETGRHEKCGNGFSRFPFNVAMRELGMIKAASRGPCNMVSSPFYSTFSVVSGVKAFRPADGRAYSC